MTWIKANHAFNLRCATFTLPFRETRAAGIREALVNLREEPAALAEALLAIVKESGVHLEAPIPYAIDVDLAAGVFLISIEDASLPEVPFGEAPPRCAIYVEANGTWRTRGPML